MVDDGRKLAPLARLEGRVVADEAAVVVVRGVSELVGEDVLEEAERGEHIAHDVDDNLIDRPDGHVDRRVGSGDGLAPLIDCAEQRVGRPHLDVTGIGKET